MNMGGQGTATGDHGRPEVLEAVEAVCLRLTNQVFLEGTVPCTKAVYWGQHKIYG